MKSIFLGYALLSQQLYEKVFKSSFRRKSIQNNFETLLEEIICYIDTINEYLDVKLFILVNLNCYLTDEELCQLYEFAIMKNVRMLIINSRHCTSEMIEMDGVRRYIIDEDLCEILQLYQKLEPKRNMRFEKCVNSDRAITIAYSTGSSISLRSV